MEAENSLKGAKDNQTQVKPEEYSDQDQKLEGQGSQSVEEKLEIEPEKKKTEVKTYKRAQNNCAKFKELIPQSEIVAKTKVLNNLAEAAKPDEGSNAEDTAAENDEVDRGHSSTKSTDADITSHDHITVIAGDPTTFQCNICESKFRTKAQIKYHTYCHGGNKPYKCEQCGQGFVSKSHYDYHLRTHSGEKPYACPQCGKEFNQQGKVTRHMKSHTGEKPFVCKECGRRFVNTQALRCHTMVHTGERPFACKICQKRFTGKTNLRKHLITHTGERPFLCVICNRSYGLKWTLDLHLRTHSGERPFECNQCKKTFTNTKDLKRHSVIHSGERPFPCWICGTTFKRKDNLDRHIKNTHNQPTGVPKKLANEAPAVYFIMNNVVNDTAELKSDDQEKVNDNEMGNDEPDHDLSDTTPSPSQVVMNGKPDTGGYFLTLVTSEEIPTPIPVEEGLIEETDTEVLNEADKDLSFISAEEFDYELLVETQEASQQTDSEVRIGDGDDGCKVLIGRPVSILLKATIKPKGNSTDDLGIMNQDFPNANGLMERAAPVNNQIMLPPNYNLFSHSDPQNMTFHSDCPTGLLSSTGGGFQNNQRSGHEEYIIVVNR